MQGGDLFHHALGHTHPRVHVGHFASLVVKTGGLLGKNESRYRIVVTSAPVKSWTRWSLAERTGRGQRVMGFEPTTFTLAT